MLAGPIVEPFLDAATCSEQGPRRHNADAAAYYRSLRTGMVAVAVADGVGDSPQASWAAHLAADHAVRVAADTRFNVEHFGMFGAVGDQRSRHPTAFTVASQ